MSRPGRPLLRIGLADLVAELHVDRKADRAAEKSFRGGHYQRHNARRLEHLASLRLELVGKRVLEVGAGIGDHTSFFLDRDCTVVATEPRPENCRVFAANLESLRRIGYAKAANVTLMPIGVDGIARSLGERFDIVYCYGLLYHVSDPAGVLTVLAERCADLLLLETCVSFGTDEAVNLVPEERGSPTQSTTGRGCRPTRPWLMRELRRHYEHVYVPATQPAHEEFPCDWTRPELFSGRFARAVFIASRRPLANPQLLDRLPDRQERA
ncbi:MAG TPA: DUF1698 domain-containing protein [Stellaceae bacterium]|nr:DUF1698 domain-containing protein [Stellaceae bacterium]